MYFYLQTFISQYLMKMIGLFFSERETDRERDIVFSHQAGYITFIIVYGHVNDVLCNKLDAECGEQTYLKR